MLRTSTLFIAALATLGMLGTTAANAQVAPEEAPPPADSAPPSDADAPVADAAPPPVADAYAADSGAAAMTPAVAAEVPSKDAAAPLKVTGSYFTRYELRENYDKLGMTTGRISESDSFVYRARIGLATAPRDIGNGRSVMLRFVPQATGVWADRPGTLADSAMNTHEAVLRLAGDGYWFDIGRFEMIYGDHLVIGNVGWNEVSRSFDGARLHVEVGDKGAWVDGFATQVSEGRITGQTNFLDGDVIFTGVYAGLGAYVDKKTDLDVYALAKIAPAVSGGNDFAPEITLGSRFKKRMGTVDVRAEGGVQVGKRVIAGTDVDVLAFQGEAEVGVHLANDKARLAVGGFFASGDDASTTDKSEAWNQLYPTAHKFLGFMDIIGGRSNVLGGMLRAKYNGLAMVKLGADGHIFLRPETPDGVDSLAGMELDSWALYPIGKGLGLRGGYHIFVPNDSGQYGVDDLVHYVEIQLKYTLK